MATGRGVVDYINEQASAAGAVRPLVALARCALVGLGVALGGLAATVGSGAPGSAALAQPSDHGRPQSEREAGDASQDERWRRRFPQPVAVADLIGRRMLDRDQGVLGRVEAVAETPDGMRLIAFARRHLLLFRGETVAVPLKATAALGPFVMILDLSFDEINRLPPFSPSAATPLDRAARIEMALTKH